MKKRIVTMIPILWMVAIVSSCQQQTKPQVSHDTFVKEKVYTVTGVGKDFATAKSDAFVNLVKRAVIELAPQSYEENPKDVDLTILPGYKSARHFVLGEVKKAPKDKSVKIKTGSDEEGNVVLTVTGWVNRLKLKNELLQMGYDK